jgi:hypothetical protein
MKAVSGDWTIVLAGSWNMAILNPSWMAREIFCADPITVEVVVGEGTLALRYSHHNVAITPHPERIIFNATDASEAGLQTVEELACRLLEKLPVTPLVGVGINFGFEEDDVRRDVSEIFNIRDTGKFAEHNLPVSRSSIIRQIDDYDDRQINFRMSLENAILRMHFNFHKPVEAGPQAIAALRGKAVEYKDFSLSLLRTLYDLEIGGPNEASQPD